MTNETKVEDPTNDKIKMKEKLNAVIYRVEIENGTKVQKRIEV